MALRRHTDYVYSIGSYKAYTSLIITYRLQSNLILITLTFFNVHCVMFVIICNCSTIS